MKLTLRILLAGAMVVALVAAGGGGDDTTEIDDPDVEKLTRDTFNSFVEGQELTLVEFYAPVSRLRSGTFRPQPLPRRPRCHWLTSDLRAVVRGKPSDCAHGVYRF